MYDVSTSSSFLINSISYTRQSNFDVHFFSILKLCDGGAVVKPWSFRRCLPYGLPKTHKKVLSVRPILSATATYNYPLAKWLDNKLKPLSINKYTITDTFMFAEHLRQMSFNEDDILVSYDVTSQFTNVPSTLQSI